MSFLRKLTKSSIIVLAIWTAICIVSAIGSPGEITIGQWIFVWIFGAFIYVGAAQGISLFFHKKHKKAEIHSPIKIPSMGDASDNNQGKDFDTMEGHDFEYFCADLLSENGYSDVEVTKGSGDQGIDIVAHKDGIKYGIQCKCYSSDIGNKAVQEAFAGKTFYNCHIAAVLTNRYFTTSAKQLAEKNGVLLWDRDFLESLIDKAE